ncbi:MAG TPA: PAS domain-containing protein [Candidatus Limnocylindria bacterium]|nr:PAS domain-containing protein [Candidatus Limnocylindria bacterium]
MSDRLETPESERRRVRGRRLTDRQTVVLELVAAGLENKEIGHRMGLSEQAVKEHVSALLQRLAVRNRAALAEIATQLRIVGTMDLEPQWLEYVFQRSPVMKAIVRGPDHIFVAANTAYRHASGDREIIGRPFREVFPEGAQAVLDEVYATGEPQVLHDFRGRWGPETEPNRYAEVSLQPLPGPDGVSGISILAVDVTDAVRARQELAELSAEQLAMFDLVPSGIVVLDRRGVVVKVNRAAQALLGAGPFGEVNTETAKAYKLRDAATGRDFPSVEDALARTFAGEAIRDLRLRMFLPALGREAHVRVDATPLRSADGEVRAVVAAVTEIVEHSVPA